MVSWVVEIYAWSVIWNFFDLTQPQRSPTEKWLKDDEFWWFCQKSFFFFKYQNKILKSSNPQIQESGRLKSEVVIFQAFKTSSAYLTSPASATSPASTALNANFLKTKSGPDGLIITGTKLTNTGHFLWNGSPKIQFFTKLWHSFWRRLLRLREVKRVSNDGSGINFHYAGSHWASLLDRFVKRSGQARSLLSVKT